MRHICSALINSALLVLLVVPFKAQSQQQYFLKTSSTSGVDFNYQWQSFDGTHELIFLLSHANINNLPHSAAAYNASLAQSYIYKNLLEYAKTIDPKVAKISIKGAGSSLQMEVSGKFEDQVNPITETLDKKYQEAEADYLTKHYFISFRNEIGGIMIKQDHIRYAEESSHNLNAIVLAIKKRTSAPYNTREFIDFTLNWLQTIP
jgi:hypothetical protein